ncbi:LacI family DNA-binding transcriptional regulator [Microbacterium sp. zg-Y818]|uniref:LacI family DNA-binding transcriptional regulator n=1 Tax=unclassified Microbacterium TaxID=2609290 RepID=UPI00214BD258|nr:MULTISPECIES: LacI family DNA-binding transcriptional regulator [unclassified Microbacterium]MCR2799402.1 LacI family transcriptional regulator [Microbacterium sp. zg.Y818]WIM21401.1 LacI family DNA-binding transcriptional regulator [Microbacterium sp. zg-Y818]
MRQPTVEDVARLAGVSRQTVSNVLNSPAVVRAGTRERVENAIVQLGYAPSMAARRLRTRRSDTIGVHLDPYSGGISGVVLDRFVHALTDRATPRGLGILVYAATDAQEELERLRALRDGGEIDRVVLTGTVECDPRTAWLREVGLPFVSFGRPWGAEWTVADHAWVDVDGAAGTRAATAFARGHGRRVAFLGWPRGSGTGDDRERGWREAMGEDAAEDLRRTSLDTVQAARTEIELLLATTTVDAVVCASDTLAVGAHLAASHAGRADVTVVGFDNTPVAAALGLSSVEQRPEQVAEAVLDLLVSGAEPGGRLIEPELVVRTGVV